MAGEAGRRIQTHARVYVPAVEPAKGLSRPPQPLVKAGPSA